MITKAAERGSADMGTFSVAMGVGNLSRGALTAVEATVDTGAFHTMLPASLLAELGISPLERQEFGVADGSVSEYGVGMARIGLDGREWHCPVIFGPEGQYLLGATTLEIFTMTVDMVEGRLIPRELRARPI